MFTANRNMDFVTLNLSWTTSKARDTYGYNIVRLDDKATGERFKTCGDGYDMVGTVLAHWLEATCQEELQAFCKANKRALVGAYGGYWKHPDLYGMSVDMDKGTVRLDGGCGESSMIRIAEAIGLKIESKTEKKRGKGYERTGFYVSKARAE